MRRWWRGDFESCGDVIFKPLSILPDTRWVSRGNEPFPIFSQISSHHLLLLERGPPQSTPLLSRGGLLCKFKAGFCCILSPVCSPQISPG